MEISIKRTNYTPGLALSIHRQWGKDSRLTWRHCGINLYRNLPWWRPKFGTHADVHGRHHIYLGYICVWHDVFR